MCRDRCVEPTADLMPELAATSRHRSPSLPRAGSCIAGRRTADPHDEGDAPTPGALRLPGRGFGRGSTARTCPRACRSRCTCRCALAGNGHTGTCRPAARDDRRAPGARQHPGRRRAARRPARAAGAGTPRGHRDATRSDDASACHRRMHRPARRMRQRDVPEGHRCTRTPARPEGHMRSQRHVERLWPAGTCLVFPRPMGTAILRASGAAVQSDAGGGGPRCSRTGVPPNATAKVVAECAPFGDQKRKSPHRCGLLWTGGVRGIRTLDRAFDPILP